MDREVDMRETVLEILINTAVVILGIMFMLGCWQFWETRDSTWLLLVAFPVIIFMAG